jgi:hypothetical protein
LEKVTSKQISYLQPLFLVKATPTDSLFDSSYENKRGVCEKLFGWGIPLYHINIHRIIK